MATLQTVIGVYISPGEGLQDFHERVPVSTKATVADIVKFLVKKLFGGMDPAQFALYEAEYAKGGSCTSTFWEIHSFLFISLFISLLVSLFICLRFLYWFFYWFLCWFLYSFLYSGFSSFNFVFSIRFPLFRSPFCFNLSPIHLPVHLYSSLYSFSNSFLDSFLYSFFFLLFF